MTLLHGCCGPCGDEAPPFAEEAMSSRWKSRSSLTSGLLERSADAQPLNAPSPSVPETPLTITTAPLSRSSALADSGAASAPGASNLSSTGMFCRSPGWAGAVAATANVSGCSPALARPVIVTLRSSDITALALMASMRLLTRSRTLENSTAPSVTVTRSTTGALASGSAPGVAGRDGGPSGPVRSRSSGTCSTGRVMTSSVTCGWPDQTLASVTSACTLPTVRRLEPSRPFGSCKMTSFMVTFSDGHTPIRVAPAIVRR